MSNAVHISLKVSDLEKSVDFYRRLFGEPQKLKPDYAKFVGEQPRDPSRPPADAPLPPARRRRPLASGNPRRVHGRSSPPPRRAARARNPLRRGSPRRLLLCAPGQVLAFRSRRQPMGDLHRDPGLGGTARLRGGLLRGLGQLTWAATRLSLRASGIGFGQLSLPRRAAAEAVATALLLAAIVGSGIAGERLSGGNVAVALLANSLASGAALAALILAFAPISGAHLNPVVSLAEAWRGALALGDVPAYAMAQLVGAFIGVAAAHAMFGEPLLSFARQPRGGPARILSEAIATFGLVVVIRGSSPVGTARCRGRSRDLHPGSVLVYFLDLVRQPGGHPRALRERHVLRNSPGRSARVSRRPVRRRRRGRRLPEGDACEMKESP